MVAVGFFGENDAKLLMIVRAQEYGAFIKPKNGKYLMVPKGKKPSDGYYRLKSVRIPARPFLRTAFEDNEKKYSRYILNGLDRIAYKGDTAMGLLNRLGTIAVADIRKSMIKWSKPANAPLTIERKGANNPLIDSGEMLKKVTYKIIKS